MTEDDRMQAFKVDVLAAMDRLELSPPLVISVSISMFVSFLFTQARDPVAARDLAHDLLDDAMDEGIRLANLVDPEGDPEKVLN